MGENSKPSPDKRLTGLGPDDCAAVMVYTTFPDLAAAQALGRRLVERQLAGCINIMPGMVSLYIWKGAVEESHECVLIAKTMPERAAACMAAIAQAHPYETPAVLALPVTAGGLPYLDWLRQGCGLPAVG